MSPIGKYPILENKEVGERGYLPDVNIAEFIKDNNNNDTNGFIKAIEFVKNNFPEDIKPRLIVPRRSTPYKITKTLPLTKGMTLIGDFMGMYGGNHVGSMPTIQFVLGPNATNPMIASGYIELINGASIQGLVIDCSKDVSSTAGKGDYQNYQRPAIKIMGDDAPGTRISNMRIYSPYIGIQTAENIPTNFGRAVFENIFLHNVRHTGLSLGNGASGAWDFVMLRNIEIWHNRPGNPQTYGDKRTSIGFDIGKIDGLMMSDCGIFECHTGLRFRYNPTHGGEFSTIGTVDNCMFDICDWSIHIAGSNKISVTGSAWNMAHHHGVKVAHTYPNFNHKGAIINDATAVGGWPTVILSGLDLVTNGASPIQIEGVNELVISGCNFTTKNVAPIYARNVNAMAVTGCVARIYGDYNNFMNVDNSNNKVNEHNVIRKMNLNLAPVIRPGRDFGKGTYYPYSSKANLAIHGGINKNRSYSTLSYQRNLSFNGSLASNGIFKTSISNRKLTKNMATISSIALKLLK